MKLKSGITHEAVKYKYGNSFTDAGGQIYDDLYYKEKSINLISAKNDFAAFQIMLEADEDFLLSISDSTTFSPLVKIPILRLEVCFESIKGVNCSIHPERLIEDDDKVLKADLLLHDETVMVMKDVGQPVWVEFNILENCCEKMIKGSVNLYIHTLFEDEVKIEALEFLVKIVDVKLPKPENFNFYLNLWQHPSNIARKHEVKLWSDEHFKVLENYIKSLAEIGQKAITLVVSEIPWIGQRCFSVKNNLSNLFEYNIIQVQKDQKGELILDFTAMDRYIELCFKYGINSEIEIIGLINVWSSPADGFGKIAEDYPDAIRIRYYDKKQKKYRFINNAKDIKAYFGRIQEHLIQKGWIDIARLMADEPAEEVRYELCIKTVKEIAPRCKFKTAINHTSFIRKFQNEITDFVPFVKCMFEDWETFKGLKENAKGRCLWYTCCGFLPDSCIRSSLLETRFIGWLTAYLELDGFLRWNYTVWPDSPKERINWNYPIFPAGENNFVYPGNDGRPILTLRYKSLKRGIMDFEIINKLKKVKLESSEVLKKVYKDIIKSSCFGNDIMKINLHQLEVNTEELFSLQYKDYEEAKRLLLYEIEKAKA